MSNPELPPAYEKLSKLSEEAYLLSNTASLVSWDQETYMPKGSVDFRAKQSAYLSGKIHSLMTSKRVGDLIAECEAANLPKNSVEAVNVREWRYAYDREAKLPKRLVEEFEETRALAHAVWVEARAESDFSKFEPHLDKVLHLMRKKAECWGYEDQIYDALLENYERGARTVELEKLFDQLQPDLVELVAQATSQDPRVSKKLLKGKYTEAKQRAFNAEIAAGIGFDFDHGRIDTAVHPFCTTLGPKDVRLTTRYDRKDFLSSLYGVLHEAGHGMYEQGLPRANGASLPIANAISLGIHESQSRLWENHVGRGKAFWERWLPVAAKHFSKKKFKNVSAEQMFRTVNRAERSFIRVEADEVTYDLHIILRFRIEQALISGDLPVADLPAVWNATFKDLFGMKVKKDSNGCLQDVHWSFGLIGYFPTYSLGNIAAAQLYRTAISDSTIRKDIKHGRYESLLSWLRENVHQHGTRYMPAELVKKATGELPNPKYLLEHLRDRYLY